MNTMQFKLRHKRLILFFKQLKKVLSVTAPIFFV